MRTPVGTWAATAGGSAVVIVTVWVHDRHLRSPIATRTGRLASHEGGGAYDAGMTDAPVPPIATPYEDLLRHVMEHGTPKADRTGTGTRSVFGHQLRFDLSAGFPLVTTKR